MTSIPEEINRLEVVDQFEVAVSLLRQASERLTCAVDREAQILQMLEELRMELSDVRVSELKRLVAAATRRCGELAMRDDKDAYAKYADQPY